MRRIACAAQWLLVAALLLLTRSAAVAADPTSFSDDFEGPTLDPFWTVSAQSGYVTFPSTAQTHSGTQSVQFNSTNTGLDKHVSLYRFFETPQYGTVSVWVYDTAATSPSSNYFYLQLFNTALGKQTLIFSSDYNFAEGDTYNFVSWQGVAVESSIPRSTGWHLWTIEAKAASLRIYVDGQMIYTGAGGVPFDSLRLYMGGPSWRPAWTGYFDDFSFNAEVSDSTGPEITIDAPVDGAVYTLNQSVNASYDCTDEGSGVDTCVGTVADGAPLDTGSVGVKSFTVEATDNAGNETSRTVTYTVAYAVKLLYDPDRPVKSGATIPIKIQLCDASGANVSSAATVVHAARVVKVSDNVSSEPADAGNANPENDFRFDATLGGSGGYIFNLSTKGLSTGTYHLVLTAGESPHEYVAPFQVK